MPDHFTGNSNDKTEFGNNYGRPGEIITVTSSKGGVWKTTLAMVIGGWIAKSSVNQLSRGLYRMYSRYVLWILMFITRRWEPSSDVGLRPS